MQNRDRDMESGFDVKDRLAKSHPNVPVILITPSAYNLKDISRLKLFV